MKTKILLLSASLLLIKTSAQVTFQDHFITNDTGIVDNPIDVYSIDIDNDGDMDVLSAFLTTILYYENDGQGNFGIQQSILTGATGVSSIYPTDIDGDGNIDIVAAHDDPDPLATDKIVWYKNDGQGNFGIEQVITTNADGPRFVNAGDIDGDGDTDILSSSSIDGKIAWYENVDGSGSFGTQQIIAILPNYASSMVLASDVDGDADLDIIYKGGWIENTDGQGSFGSAQGVAGCCGKIFPADLDGDGDIDILSTTGSRVIWNENTDGQGNFGPRQDISVQSGTDSIFSADIDNDGDLDILYTYDHYISNSDYKRHIVWHKNDGSGNFGPKIIISTNIHIGEAYIYISDINNDSDKDLILAYRDGISWSPNTGQGIFSFPRAISKYTDYPTSVCVADMDNDGNMDVISSSKNDYKIAWYPNINGEEDYSLQRIVTITSSYPYETSTIDMDMDNDMDILVRQYNKITWYENTDGSGNFNPYGETIIEFNNDIRIDAIFLSDIDNDNDDDILLTICDNNDNGYESNSLIWIENTDGLGNYSSEQFIHTEQIINTGGGDMGGNMYSTRAGDLDGDGDMDALLSIAANDPNLNDFLVWFENTGQGSFGNSQVIAQDLSYFILTKDIDSDGDIDVISQGENHYIYWYENDGQGNFAIQQIIANDGSNYEFGHDKICAVDMDGDGDPDIVSFESNPVWYENINGLGMFGGQQIISANITGVNAISCKDIDVDGDIDVLSTNSYSDQIVWYENLINLSIEEVDSDNLETEKTIVYPNPTTGSLNIDSKTPVARLEIFNQLGQCLLKTNTTKTDISHFSEGLFFLKIIFITGKSEIKKILKK